MAETCFKLYILNGETSEIRYCKFPRNGTILQSLRDKVHTLIGTAAYKMYWKDSEEDNVMINSEEELEVAIDNMEPEEKVLKIFAEAVANEAPTSGTIPDLEEMFRNCVQTITPKIIEVTTDLLEAVAPPDSKRAKKCMRSFDGPKGHDKHGDKHGDKHHFKRGHWKRPHPMDNRHLSDVVGTVAVVANGIAEAVLTNLPIVLQQAMDTARDAANAVAAATARPPNQPSEQATAPPQAATTASG